LTTGSGSADIRRDRHARNRRSWIGIYLFSQAADGLLLATTTTATSGSRYAYAVAAGGATQVLLVNTSALTSYDVAIRFGNPVSRASLVT